MSTFYFEEGWYPSEHLAKLLEANKKMNDHLAKAIGELGEGEVHTIHKWGAEKKEWVGLTDEELEFYTEELGQGELGRGVLRAVDDFLKEKNNASS